MANTKLATQKTAEITKAGALTLVASVKEGMKLVSQGYLAITPDVAKLYDCKGYKALGYKNFDEMCTMEFGMSHGTTVGIRKVFDKFGSVSVKNEYTIPEKYLEFGYTKLLLFTDKKFNEAGINPIEAFTPEMTMAEMKDVLKSKLEDKAEKQDAEAIETTAEDVSRETSEQAEEKSIIDNSEDSDYIATDKEVITDLIATAQALHTKMDYLKPEKAVLWDAVIANLKELKKFAK